MGVAFQASAPGRCGILGNPSDIYGGHVLSCSVPSRARCRIELGASEELPDDTRLWDAAVSRYPLRGAARVTWETEIPRSSGLSGSTALLAATLACILAADLQPPRLDGAGRIAFAELVRDIERNEAGIMCGFQDAYMVVHGGLQLVNYVGKHPLTAGPPATLKALDVSELPFLLVTTGVERLSGAVNGPMSERWLAGEKTVVDAIARISDLAMPGAEALERGDLQTLARLMNENQRLIADVGGSGEPVDRLVEECLREGALAAKLAGAGLGGTVIVLTEDPERLEASLRLLGYLSFRRPAISEGLRFEEPSSL